VSVNSHNASLTSVGHSDPATYVNPNITLTYDAALTPVVKSLTPNNGSALGGSVVTLTGTGFIAGAPQNHSIWLNGFECPVKTATATQLTCVVATRGAINPLTTLVHVDGLGYALLNDSVRFRYLDRWSEVNTWFNLEPPLEGDTVWIPRGQTVLLDKSPPRLFLMVVQGLLVFDRRDLALNASYIYVQGGRIEIGTEAEPFLQRATVTLHGDRKTAIELPVLGSKMIAVTNRVFSDSHENLMVMQAPAPTTDKDLHGHASSVAALQDASEGVGMLDFHGRPRKRVWTKIAEDVLPGSGGRGGGGSLRTSEPVDFEAGEKIIITSHVDMWQIEEVEVLGISDDGRTVFFTPDVQYVHESRMPVIEGQVVDMRVEVALLSRNVVIQGDDQSDSQQYGVHTMMAHGGQYRVENCEYRRAGQAYVLGRYPIHFHMTGDCPQCYARSNSIHHTYQRAVTVHGAHQVRVQHNVAYHTMGHTYFVEDGIERYNLLEENLAAYTLRSFSLLKSDVKPASFWTASPTNFWRSNVAAGCQNDGYWFELAKTPGGASFGLTTDVCPSLGHLGEWVNNTAHSNGIHGLRIYPFYAPMVSCDAGSATLPVTFKNFTTWHNGENGVFGKINGDIHHLNLKSVENGATEIGISFAFEIPFSNYPNLINALLVGNVDPSGQRGQPAIKTPISDHWFVSGATFVNYPKAVIEPCTHCNKYDSIFASQAVFTHRFRGLKFVNSPIRVKWMDPFKDILFDMDGSLTGIVNGSLSEHYKFNVGPDCTRMGVEYSYGIICNANTRVRRLTIMQHAPSQLDFASVTLWQTTPGAPFFNTFDTIPFLPRDKYGWHIPIVVGRSYMFKFTSTATEFQTLSLTLEPKELLEWDWDAMRAMAGPNEFSREWLGLSVPFIEYRYAFSVQRDKRFVPWLNLSQSVLPSPTDVSGTGMVFNKTFYTVLTPNNITRTNMFANPLSSLEPWRHDVAYQQCPPDGCNAAPFSGVSGPPKLWSSASTWASGRVPRAGESVTIPAGVWVVMDVSPPAMDLLDIKGLLQFQNLGADLGEASKQDLAIAANRISVSGMLQVGNKTHPYVGTATITLTGTLVSPSLVLSNTISLGNKVLAVTGQLELVGQKRTAWTKLSATARAGDRTITLVGAVSLAAGETVVVSATEYDRRQSEECTVESTTSGTDSNGATTTIVTLKNPLAFSHWAETVPLGSEEPQVLAAAVGVYERNVRFVGNSAPDGWGAHITVFEIITSTAVARGSINAEYVQFNNVGKLGTPYAAINTKMFPTSVPSKFRHLPTYINITGCSFHNLQNNALSADNTVNVLLDYNVISNSVRHAVDIKAGSTGAVLTRNLVAGVRRYSGETTDFVVPIAGFYLNAPVKKLSLNVVSGSDDTAYVLQGDLCTVNPSDLSVFDNEAVASVMGFFLITAFSHECVQLNRALAWKISHIAFFTTDQTANVVLRGVVSSDSHIGVSLQFFRSRINNRADVIDSKFLGATAVSNCTVSSLCRVMLIGSAADITATNTKACRSELNGHHHVGILFPQYLNRPKSCLLDPEGASVCNPQTIPNNLCGMPWEKSYGLPVAPAAIFAVTNTHFAYFNHGSCGSLKSYAVMKNPSQIDFVPPIEFRGITWHNVARNAKLQYTDTQNMFGGDFNSAMKGGMDGNIIITATDTDGSFDGLQVLSASGGSIIAKAPQLAAGCVESLDWQAFICPNALFRIVTIETLDPPPVTRYGPARAVAAAGGAATYSSYSTGPHDDGCAMRFFFGRYSMLLQPNKEYNVSFSGSVPSNLRMTLLSPSDAESFRLNIFYTKPFVIQVYSNRVLVPENNGTYPTLASKNGANQFDPHARQLFVNLKGSSSAYRVFDFKSTPVVAVTLNVQMSFNEFYGPSLISNLAALLKIDISRIKIVSVSAKSRRQMLKLKRRTSSPDDFEGKPEDLESSGLAIDMLILPIIPPPTSAPTSSPTASPTTASPTKAPTTAPTPAPGTPTASPTVAAPTNAPTDAPTAAPTDAPTDATAQSDASLDLQMAQLQAAQQVAQLASLTTVISTLSTTSASKMSADLGVNVVSTPQVEVIKPPVADTSSIDITAATKAPTGSPTSAPTAAPQANGVLQLGIKLLSDYSAMVAGPGLDQFSREVAADIAQALLVDKSRVTVTSVVPGSIIVSSLIAEAAAASGDRPLAALQASLTGLSPADVAALFAAGTWTSNISASEFTAPALAYKCCDGSYAAAAASCGSCSKAERASGGISMVVVGVAIAAALAGLALGVWAFRSYCAQQPADKKAAPQVPEFELSPVQQFDLSQFPLDSNRSVLVDADADAGAALRNSETFEERTAREEAAKKKHVERMRNSINMPKSGAKGWAFNVPPTGRTESPPRGLSATPSRISLTGGLSATPSRISLTGVTPPNVIGNY